MAVGVLRRKRQETGDPQRDPSGHCLRLDPKGNPGHHDDQTGRDVGMEEVISQATSELEYDLQAGEIPYSIYVFSKSNVISELGLRLTRRID